MNSSQDDQPRDDCQSKQASRGLYQCTQCQRTYTRVDHLARHVRSHLQERPFECTICHKAFGRPDLLKRHAQCHDPDNNGAKRQRLNGSERGRVSTACLGCATAKVKCDDEKPCTRCRQYGIICQYSGDLRFTRKSSKAAAEASVAIHSDSGAGASAATVKSTDGYENIAPHAPNDSNEDSISEDQELHGVPGKLPTPAATTAIKSDYSPTVVALENQFSEFLRDVMAPPDAISNAFGTYGQDNSRDVLDFCMNDPVDFDMGLNLELLDQLCPRDVPDMRFGLDQDSNRVQQQHISPQELCDDSTYQALGQPSKQATISYFSQAGLGMQAFQRSSLSRWSPAQQDNGERSLINPLSAVAEDTPSPRPHLAPRQRVLSQVLDAKARDRLLAMVLSVCEDAKASIIAEAFPPSPLLDDLIQAYFIQDQQASTQFIHAPTFNLSSQKAELLAAVIAGGAVSSHIKVLKEFGFAIQESIRLIVPKRCEWLNAVTREIWLVQAFLSEVEISLWSGNRRKMEIAESHTQTLFTMLRRNCKFQKLKSPAPGPLFDDTGETLQRKWLDWVHQESYKRLAFRAFLLDAQASMCLLINPLISYAEMMLPFPESRELWMAEDAEQWKSIYLQKQSCRPETPPYLLGLLQHPEQLSTLWGCYDLHFSVLVILHGLWGIIWEHTQLTSVFETYQANAAMALQRQDIYRILSHLRMTISEAEELQSPEISLMLELLTMYLHVSLEKIQLFAGKEDLEEARRVLPALQEWATVSNARQAICNAGQVLCAAKAFQPNQLRGFWAVAVYHASLTCWAYGLISFSQQKPVSRLPATVVWLDGPKSDEVERFITLGRGTPSIGPPLTTDMSVAQLVPLSDPVAVMNVMISILRTNMKSEVCGDPTPPLVANLTQLMLDLGEAGLSVVNGNDLFSNE